VTEGVARRVWQALPERVRRPILSLKYGAPAERQWLREQMNRDLREVLDGLHPARCDAIEVSGALRADLPWRSYTALSYPEFDLCSSRAPRQFDVVICEQVLEHVPDPCRATATLRDLCLPDGVVLVSVPFLLRIHRVPGDYWRFTPDGLHLLLSRAGLDVEWVRSWGNRSAAAANLGRWAFYRPWHSLRNDSERPLVVWALARRSDRSAPGPMTDISSD
jgi:SAM-dependent methyltransferase